MTSETEGIDSKCTRGHRHTHRINDIRSHQACAQTRSWKESYLPITGADHPRKCGTFASDVLSWGVRQCSHNQDYRPDLSKKQLHFGFVGLAAVARLLRIRVFSPEKSCPKKLHGSISATAEPGGNTEFHGYAFHENRSHKSASGWPGADDFRIRQANAVLAKTAVLKVIHRIRIISRPESLVCSVTLPVIRTIPWCGGMFDVLADELHGTVC